MTERKTAEEILLEKIGWLTPALQKSILSAMQEYSSQELQVFKAEIEEMKRVAEKSLLNWEAEKKKLHPQYDCDYYGACLERIAEYKGETNALNRVLSLINNLK